MMGDDGGKGRKGAGRRERDLEVQSRGVSFGARIAGIQMRGGGGGDVQGRRAGVFHRDFLGGSRVVDLCHYDSFRGLLVIFWDLKIRG
jgi:hypothetical protein